MNAVTLTLTVPGAPRTKKTSNRLLKFGGRLKVVPSDAWLSWRDFAVPQIARARNRLPDGEYNVAALFYRDARRGDALGYYQGLADVLQEAGVVANDKQLVSWDGSRLRKDARNPRVEVTLTPATEVSGTGSG